MTPTKKSKPKKTTKPDSARLRDLIARAQPWTEDMLIKDIKEAGTLSFTAKSYQAAANEFTQWILDAHGMTLKDLPYKFPCGHEFGVWPLPNKTDVYHPPWLWSKPKPLDEYDPVCLNVNNRNLRIAQVFFDDHINIPRLGLGKRADPWMSYTFSEVISLNGGIRMAKGNVIIGGLGMGWFAKRVMDKPGVKHVWIVERDEPFLDFFGAAFKKQYGDRVTLVHDDAFAFAATHGHKVDRILMDVWPEYGNQHDRRWLTLKKLFEGSKTKLWQWS